MINVTFKFIKFQEITISQNQSSEFEFNGILGKWLLENNNSIGLIESKLIGIKDENNKVITLDKLMSNEMIDFNCNKYGIYIPWDELLTRVNYQWFSYLTVEEVLNSNIIEHANTNFLTFLSLSFHLFKVILLILPLGSGHNEALLGCGATKRRPQWLSLRVQLCPLS